MTKCPDKLEPLSDSDMLLFIKLTLQDVLSVALSDPPYSTKDLKLHHLDDMLEIDTIQKALKYTITLKEKL